MANRQELAADAETCLSAWISNHLLPMASSCTDPEMAVAYAETLAQANLLFIYLDLLSES